MNKVIIFLVLLAPLHSIAQQWGQKFEQLGETLPTPNEYRTGSGAPGTKYWQQQADYEIKVAVDDEKARLSGEETITYHNNSPDELPYLWVQLDQNMRAEDSDTPLATSTSISNDTLSAKAMKQYATTFDGGFKIQSVKSQDGSPLSFIINKTMMRIDLPTPLKPGQKTSFFIEWWYNINDRMKDSGRSGYEHFPKDGNNVYTIAQFFPRMAVYDDYEGWQNKQFLGRGEFTLSFGDYNVEITVPEDHIVASTGELQNPQTVLSGDQIKRFEQARNSFDRPVVIVNQKEAEKNEKTKAKGQKTWVFQAKNVRDFAFATSRKFIWDAQAVKVGNNTVMAMSYYPKEGNPLGSRNRPKR